MMASTLYKNRKLTDLHNIGKKIADRLCEVGIYSEKELRQVGAVGAYKRIKEKYPDEILPVCYYLYSFEGALQNQHWDAIGEARKCALRAEISVKPESSGITHTRSNGINTA